MGAVYLRVSRACCKLVGEFREMMVSLLSFHAGRLQPCKWERPLCPARGLADTGAVGVRLGREALPLPPSTLLLL